jgi:Domain of unknown function (DUF2017)
MSVLSRFRRRGEVVTRRFSAAERAMLEPLIAGLVETLDHSDDLSAYDDPSMRRLLPNAYPDDVDASAEFAAATRAALADGKAERARQMLRALSTDVDARGGIRLSIDRGDAIDWLKTLGDLRLSYAERYGIDRLQSDPWSRTGALYGWLTWLQGDLVESLTD